MDVVRARSPPASASLARRPIGPRSPGKPGTLPVKNIIPLDLTARLQDEFGASPRTSSPETIPGNSSSSGSGSWPESPAFAPIPLQPAPLSRSQSQSSMGGNQINGLYRSDSTRSEGVVARKDLTPSLEDADEVVAPPETEVEMEQTRPRTPPTAVFIPKELKLRSNPTMFSGTRFPVDDTALASGAATSLAPVSGSAAAQPPDVTPTVASPEPPASTSAPATAGPPAVEAPVIPDIPPLLPSVDSAESLTNTVPPPPPLLPHEQEYGPTVPRTDDSRPPSGLVNGIDGINVNDHKRIMAEKSVQASIVASSPPPSISGRDTPASRTGTPALKVVPIRPPLAPPPALSFEHEPIKWKGMTLEAAQWTFTSGQLQEIVSQAIRHSASESFIRVVPTDVIDNEIPPELERLEALRATTQAQYRFNVHRRAMLLQSLAALSQSQPTDDLVLGEPLYNLTVQLANLTASCDRLTETLVQIADQKAQIQHVQDLHVASALSMALRKLNTSYAKRTTELQTTRAHNDELRAELEEAWNLAQDMAQEMDDLDNFNLDFSDEEDYTPDREHHHNHGDEDGPSNSALEADIYSDLDRMSGFAPSVRSAEVIEITGTAVATKAMLTNVGAGARSQTPGDRTSRVFSAKKRSSRASKASLRIPRTPTNGNANGNGERPDRSSVYSIRSIRSMHQRHRSRSKSMRRAEHGEGGQVGTEVPQVPIIRLPEPRSREGSFLELIQTRPGSPAVAGAGADASAGEGVHVGADAPPPLPPKEGLDDGPGLSIHLAASRSEEMLPSRTPNRSSNLPLTPTFGAIPMITVPDQEEQYLHEQQEQEQDQQHSQYLSLQQQQQPYQKPPKSAPSSWRGRGTRFFTRRAQSMQPQQPLQRPADDDTAAIGRDEAAGASGPLRRAASEAKHFDGWPFKGASKVQRFSAPVLAAIQPSKGRKSSDSAPPAG